MERIKTKELNWIELNRSSKEEMYLKRKQLWLRSGSCLCCCSSCSVVLVLVILQLGLLKFSWRNGFWCWSESYRHWIWWVMMRANVKLVWKLIQFHPSFFTFRKFQCDTTNYFEVCWYQSQLDYHILFCFKW